MQLSNLVIETRLRNAWSSIDLGFVFARQFWFRGVLLYLFVAFPFFVLTRIFTDYGSVLPFLILWWLKPLFERPILYFMSRELFSDKTGVLRTLLNYRDWLFPGLFSILITRRISLARAMYAPITLLERPTSSAYGSRALVLGNKFSGEGLWLTLILFFTEVVFAISLLSLLAIMFPEHIDVAIAWANDLEQSSAVLDFVTLLIMATIAPFYVAAGFILYISRRVELEGWDIEICFRDWMRNYKKPTSGVSHES